MAYITKIGSDSFTAREIKRCYEAGRVTEKVVSYKGIDDILVTKVENNRRLPNAVIVQMLMEKSPETGHSILSKEPYTRKHWMGVANEIYSHRFEFARQNGLRVDIYFPLLRYSDMIESVKVEVPSPARDVNFGGAYGVTVAVVKKLVPRCPCRDPNLYQELGKNSGSNSYESITVKLEEPVEFISDPWHAYYVRVTVPCEVLTDWADLRLSVESVYMCNALCDLLRDAPLKWHELECCPRKPEEQCDIELMTNLLLYRRVDRFPQRPEADGSSAVETEGDADKN